VKKWEACIWKRAYESEAEALAGGDDPTQDAYLCVYCCKWHRRTPMAAKRAKGMGRHFAELRYRAIKRAKREAYGL
jgi:hypothetical protein